MDVSPDVSYDDMIWELHYNKDIYTGDSGTVVIFFFSARNLFNGEQFWHSVFKNPDRWVEAGFRFSF